jgi:hypothetical protein
MLGHLGPDQLSVEAVHRFSNDPVRITDGLHCISFVASGPLCMTSLVDRQVIDSARM